MKSLSQNYFQINFDTIIVVRIFSQIVFSFCSTIRDWNRYLLVIENNRINMYSQCEKLDKILPFQTVAPLSSIYA